MTKRPVISAALDGRGPSRDGALDLETLLHPAQAFEQGPREHSGSRTSIASASASALFHRENIDRAALRHASAVLLERHPFERTVR